MTGFLLDTNVISESKKRRPAAAVVTWLTSIRASEAWISVLTLGELRSGAVRLANRDPVRAAAIADWVDELEINYAHRVLPVDVSVARAWAQISAARTLPAVDALIVATAVVHGLTVATRNTRDMDGLGAAIVNPWED